MQLLQDTPIIDPEKPEERAEELNKFKKPNSRNLLYFFQI